MFYRRTVLAAALLISFAGCQQKAAEHHRYAVIRFENLTGDSGFEWTGRAASEILVRSLTGALDGPVVSAGAITRASLNVGAHPAAAPGISSEFPAAIIAGADVTIAGYVTRTHDSYRVTAQDKDRVLSATGKTLPDAVGALAHAIAAGATPPATQNEQTLKLFAEGLEGTRDLAVSKLREAIVGDPNFGPAWTALVRAQFAAGDRDGAMASVQEALRHSVNALDKANLHLEAASIAGDSGARLTALGELAAASPGDLDLPRAIAETASATGHFADAAKQWSKLAGETPDNADVWNQMGYARAWSGDYNGAVTALSQYAKLRPVDPNAFDSLGDVQFMYRRFAEAAESYAHAVTLDPAFQGAGDKYKGAWAQFRKGDAAKADALFGEFRTYREKQNSNVVLFASDWLYRTGRTSQAVATLRGNAALREVAFTQLVVWDLMAGDRATAFKDSLAIGNPTTPAALVARFAALPSASANEWRARAERTITGVNVSAVRTLALGYALLLDNKREESRPIWQSIVAFAPGNDFFVRAIYAKLTGGPKPLELVPDPGSVNPFAALLDKL